MSDNPVSFSSDMEGQPERVSTESGIPPIGNTQAANGLTPEMVQEIVRKSISEFRSEEQGQRDKFQSRLQNEVNKRLAAIEASGIKMTDEQKTNFSNETRSQLQSESLTDNSKELEVQPKPLDPTQDDLETVVNQKAQEIYTRYGMVLDSADPEAQGLQGLPAKEFLKELEVRVSKKVQRINGPVDRSGQIPSIGASGAIANPIANVNDLEQLWDRSSFSKRS